MIGLTGHLPEVVIVVLLLVLIYPTFIAVKRKKSAAMIATIFVVSNLTPVGWVVALVLALRQDKQVTAVVPASPPLG